MQNLFNQSILGEEDPGSALDMIRTRQAESELRSSMHAAEVAPPKALPEPILVATAEAHTVQPAQVSTIAAVALARLLTVSFDATLADVAASMSSARLSLAVVCDATGSVAGVIADTLLVHQLGLGHASVFTARADEIMTREFTICHPDDSLPQVLATMHRRGLVHMPVIDADNRPQGVVYARDGLRALLAAGNFEEEQLRDYVMGVGYQ